MIHHEGTKYTKKQSDIIRFGAIRSFLFVSLWFKSHFPVKFGARFSKKAVIPSVASWVAATAASLPDRY